MEAICMSTSIDKSSWTTVQNGFVNGFEPIRRMFDHTNAMSDALKVFIRTFDLTSHFVELPRIKPFIEAFRQVVDVTNVIVFRNRLKDVCSGNALKNNPTGKGPNMVKFSSKMFFLVMDACTITSWLSRLGAFSTKIHEKMASVKVFGRQIDFNVLRNVSDAAMVTGGTLAAVNLIREGKAKGFTTVRKVSLVYELNRINGTLISRLPSVFTKLPAAPFAIFGAASMLVGSGLSLAVFFLQKYRDKTLEGKTAAPAAA
jgi:hypothetical protein